MAETLDSPCPGTAGALADLPAGRDAAARRDRCRSRRRGGPGAAVDRAVERAGDLVVERAAAAARCGGGLRSGCGGGLLGGDPGVLGGLPRGLRVDGGLLGCGDTGDQRAQRPHAHGGRGQRGADGTGRAGEGCPGRVSRVRDGGEGGVRVVDGSLCGARRCGAAVLVRRLGDDDVGAALRDRVPGGGEHVLVHAQARRERLGLGLLRPLLGGVDATACGDGEHDGRGESRPRGAGAARRTGVRREPAAARRGGTVRREAEGRRRRSVGPRSPESVQLTTDGRWLGTTSSRFSVSLTMSPTPRQTPARWGSP